MRAYSRLVFPYIMERLSAGSHVDEQRGMALRAARGEVWRSVSVRGSTSRTIPGM